MRAARARAREWETDTTNGNQKKNDVMVEGVLAL